MNKIFTSYNMNSLPVCVFLCQAFGVQQWNGMLLKITELLKCNDNDGLKLEVASMQQMGMTKR